MRLRHDERGVTLPEVLVAISVLAIIIIPLGDAMIGFVRNTDATTRRMIESHDMQIATAYFAQDIQNLGLRDWSSPTLALQQSIDNPRYPCGTGTSVIGLAWDDPTTVSGIPPNIRVMYQVRDVGGEHQLRRLQCRNSATVESDVVVVHNLVGNPDPPVCVSPTVCSDPSVPQRVTLTVTIKHPANATDISLTLTGQRRQT
jgi:prepilin-type N-terminal cleavage/methylation domain-containing protein